MKLLDVTEFYSPRGGGVRRYLNEKARWVATQRDLEHVVVIPSDRDAVTQWERSRVYLVPGPSVPASPGYHFLIAGCKLRAIVRDERPDVIEVGSPYLAPWLGRAAARGAGVRLAAFVHENPRLYIARRPRPVRAVLDRLLVRYLRAAHRGFDLLVAASRDNLPEAGRVPQAVVPLGVDSQLFHPLRRDPAWRPEVGVLPQQCVALYVGRLSAEKGLDTLLRVLPEIHRATGMRLVMIGEGHLFARLQRLSRQRPEMLTVLPFEERGVRLARAYASADLFVAPCPYETFGLAALEAMASGLPVVGVGAGGIGRLLCDADWGRTYRPGDPSDCARAVSELAATDLRAAGRRARSVAVSRYSWDRTFTELFGLYRGLLESATAFRANRTTPSAAPKINV
jgi:alpha-1,6-mannosyltransferase